MTIKLPEGWESGIARGSDDYFITYIGRFNIYSAVNEPYLILVDSLTLQSWGYDFDKNKTNPKIVIKAIKKYLKQYLYNHKQLSLF